MPERRLTEITVKALKPSAAYVSYWDDLTPGFCVRVGKRAKTFCVVRGRNRERISIGKWPDVSVSEARTEAKKLLASEPEEKIASITYGDARETFLAGYDNPRTRYNVTRLLTSHFKFGLLSAITDKDVTKALGKLADRPSEQLHAYRALRAFLRWCTRSPRRYLKHSPMEGYEPPGRDRRGTRVLTDAELKAVWNASGAAPYAIFRLMMLWGTRNMETTLLERSWALDDVLTIPGEHTKNGRDHAIPLLPIARSILDDLPGGNERYYFSSRWADSHLTHHALPKLKREVMKASGTKGWQLRDLRRTFRSNMARLKVPREVCEVLINHAPPVLDEIYDRYDRREEKREALAKYEALIHALVAQVQSGTR